MPKQRPIRSRVQMRAEPKRARPEAAPRLSLRTSRVHIAWKRPPCVTPLQVISIKRIPSGRREKVETLLVRFCFLADDECRTKTRMVPASCEHRLIIDILAPSDCAYAADPKD